MSDISIIEKCNIVDFIIDVPVGKNPIVLQLTDTQIIDAGQSRSGRGGFDRGFWATDKVFDRCYNYIKEVISVTNPDFIIITGDLVYGSYDDNGTIFQGFISFMDSFRIPWAPVFGNHDNESKMGVDWQCLQLEKSKYCLFKQRSLTGNGNYSVAIVQGGKFKRVFYMLDTNSCGDVSDESLANGHTVKTLGFGQDQIKWYTSQIKKLKSFEPYVKISFAFHIQLAIFEKAFEKYGFKKGEQMQEINIDQLNNKGKEDFGYIGAGLKAPWDKDYSIFNGMKSLGVDSIFVGHEHCNSASVVYEGVRFQYGQKSSEYDRFNYLQASGRISTEVSARSLVGGTVIQLSEDDGSLLTPYIYYCGFKNGIIDWSRYN